MTIDELIEELQYVAKQKGGDIPVMVWIKGEPINIVELDMELGDRVDIMPDLLNNAGE